jgi:ATP-dependent Clp protease ATP-binding subunit ClpC
MNNRFTQRVSDIILYSKEEANRLQNSYIGTEHLLLGMIREGEGKAIEVLSNLHVDIQDIKRQLESILRKKEDHLATNDPNINFNEEAAKVLKLCILEAKLTKKDLADTEHVLLAIMKLKDSVAYRLLESHHVSYDAIVEQLSLQPNPSQPYSGLDFSNDEEDEDDLHMSRPQGGNASARPSQTAQQKASGTDTPVLNSFGFDMTQAAEEGKLDPVVGREKEIERLAQILSRRKKNNPILIGEPGVGKSAIVEGLALRIVEKKVSRVLFNKRVISLDMTAIVAGTKYRGQFEERIRAVINEIKKSPDIIVFIDEIHTIVGAGSASGSMDAANILKPALARGEIQCIGATTLDEYRKNIETDGALERRFQKVLVEPTTTEETLQILRNIKSKYEDHHNVNFTEEALKACVKLTERYITDRNFPDKAIDALDEAGSRVHLININVPQEIKDKEDLLEDLKTRKNNAVKQQNFELAADYRDREKACAEELNKLKADWEQKLKENRETVDADEVADVVSMISGVPVQRMKEADNVALLKMADRLKEKIIGQDKAIATVVKAIQRSRIGLKDPNRPIGTFMFLGPTGVGKTHLAKELATLLFGSADSLIRIDMSEYTEKHEVSRLVGAPPGYVGHEEGGQLTEKVRRKPYSIVLFDELEKAHPEVFNLLLQVLDEGRLTDSTGHTVDFRNTVIIMTSNVGSRQLKDFGKGIGFTTAASPIDKEYSRSVITKALNKTFAPEFINRIDEIVNFDQLDMDALVRIVDIELAKLLDRVAALGYTLQVTDEAKTFLARKGYDVQYGARPLKRAIQQYVEDALSEVILGGELREGDTIVAEVNTAGDALSLHKQTPEA